MERARRARRGRLDDGRACIAVDARERLGQNGTAPPRPCRREVPPRANLHTPRPTTWRHEARSGGFRLGFWSGRRDLNPRRPPWQGGTLPLSYSRRSRPDNQGRPSSAHDPACQRRVARHGGSRSKRPATSGYSSMSARIRLSSTRAFQSQPAHVAPGRVAPRRAARRWTASSTLAPSYCRVTTPTERFCGTE